MCVIVSKVYLLDNISFNIIKSRTLKRTNSDFTEYDNTITFNYKTKNLLIRRNGLHEFVKLVDRQIFISDQRKSIHKIEKCALIAVDFDLNMRYTHTTTYIVRTDMGKEISEQDDIC